MINQLYLGDNLNILKTIPDEFVDLIYMDPPFNTGKDFKDFKDIWKDLEEYLDFIKLRLIECHRILKKTGSIYLHCDQHAVHYLKVIMDDLFQVKNFKNHIIWKRNYGNKQDKKKFCDNNDHILFYSKSKDNVFNIEYKINKEYVKKMYKKKQFNKKTGKDELCRGHMLSGAFGTNRYYQFYDYKTPKDGWLYKKQKMEDFKNDGLLLYPNKKDGLLEKIIWLKDYKGTKINTIWDDIKRLTVNKESSKYPTQKPLKLLDRIIKASSNEGDLILDPFCGSGTTCISAKRLKRNYIGIDQNLKAIEITKKRLSEIKEENLLTSNELKEMIK